MGKPTTRKKSPIGAHPLSDSSHASGDTGPPGGSDKLDMILNAIERARERLESKIDEVTVGLTLLRDDHKKLADRVAQTERSIREVQPQVKDQHAQILELADQIRFLEGRAEDAEGRAWRSNIRIVGLPEGKEGHDLLACGILMDTSTCGFLTF